MNFKKIFLIILIFSFLLQVFAHAFFKDFEPRSYPTDILNYDAVAKNLLAGKGLTISRWFPPGYSLYLAFLYKMSGIRDYQSSSIHIFNLLISALAVALSFIIFSHLFDIKAGLITAFIFSIYPLYLFLATRPGLNGPLFFFVFYLSLGLFFLSIKRKSFLIIFISGLTLGYASLTRYISLLYPLIMLAYIVTDEPFRGNRKLLLAVVFLSGYILAIIPWFAYLASRKELNFFNYLAYLVRVSFERYYIEDEIARVIIPRSEIKGSIEFLGFTLKTVITHPLSFLVIFCKNLARSWYATNGRWWHLQILLIQIPIILTAIWGGLVSLSNRIYKRNLLFCFVSILYFWVATALTAGIVRIMLAGMPFVFVFSALGIIDIYRRISSLRLLRPFRGSQ